MVELFAVGCLTQSPRIVFPRFRVSPHENSPRGRTLNEPEVGPNPVGGFVEDFIVYDAPALKHDGSPYSDSVRIALIPRQTIG